MESDAAAAMLDHVPEIARCLEARDDLWLFAYGSLMWDPGISYAEAQPALLRGYHRSFCVYSLSHRGTPDRPGLVLGLERGGACKGIAFRIAAAEVRPSLRYLWQREMANGAYRLKEVAVRLADRAVAARTLIVDRQRPDYAGRLPAAVAARLILEAKGTCGSCREYLDKTVGALTRLGLTDGPLHRLAARVEALARAPDTGGNRLKAKVGIAQ